MTSAFDVNNYLSYTNAIVNADMSVYCGLDCLLSGVPDMKMQYCWRFVVAKRDF